MNENACQGFEIAIEMRRHGAADAEASRRLDAHLQGCASCRSFDRLGAETETRLRVDAEEMKGKVDLERLRARGRRLLRGHWSDYGAFFLLLSIALAARVALRVTGIEQGDVGLQPALAILAFVLPFVAMRRSQRELEEAWSSDVIFHFLRKHVDERLKGSIGLAVVGIAISIGLFIDRVSGGSAFPAGVARAVFVGSFGALGLFVLIVRVPRLLRERREIPVVPDPYDFPPSTSTLGL
jgi:hypothetical protein